MTTTTVILLLLWAYAQFAVGMALYVYAYVDKNKKMAVVCGILWPALLVALLFERLLLGLGPRGR